jgi:hypothetical protein
LADRVAAWSRGKVPPIPDRYGVPTELAVLVARMLAHDPADRPESASIVASSLEKFCQDCNLDRYLKQGTAKIANSQPGGTGDPTQQSLLRKSASRRLVLWCLATIPLILLAAIVPCYLWTDDRDAQVRFDKPVFEVALSSRDRNVIQQFLDDGLRVVTKCKNENGFQSELCVFSRPDVDSPFSNPEPGEFKVLNSSDAHWTIESAVIAPGGLELFYGGIKTQYGTEGFYRSIRENRQQQFPVGRIVQAASHGKIGDRVFHYPQAISRDGLRLYYVTVQDSPAVVIDALFWMVERPSLDSDFGKPTQEPFRNFDLGMSNWSPPPTVPGNRGLRDNGIRLTDDELEIFFWSQRDGGAGGFDIWWARRNSIDEPFGSPVNVRTLNTEGMELGAVPLGDTLYLSRMTDNVISIYSAKRK